ncbi:MAG: DUF512 domain-containing protein [bacterium]
MKITHVDPDSPLTGQVRPGYRVLTVNGRPVLDSIDFRFRTADEQVKIRFADRSGREMEYRLDETSAGSLGLTFQDDRVRRCRCKCIFCFVHQQPKGMRRSLYVKDEDYRLSFTHGNYITLSNLTESDMARIIEQRLSPLYVSVHTTDDTLRRRMLGNRQLPPILPLLRRLTENGITLHTQVVLCPGINDGRYLKQTVDDLSALYPGIQTLAIVPVGLTRYRNGLPELRIFNRFEAADVLDFIFERQKELYRKLGTRFVWPSDEFHLLAGRSFPPRKTYEDLAQFENGVGMNQEFLAMFDRRRQHLRKIRSDRRVLFLTGRSAESLFNRGIMSWIHRNLDLNLSVRPVDNRFWGKTVTVSGLLTGRDLLAKARPVAGEFDLVVLPPNCLNADQLFLDDMSLSEFQAELGREVRIGHYDLARTIREVFA